MILKLSEKSNWNKVSMIQVSTTSLDNELIIVYLIFGHFSPKRLLRHHWGNVCWRIADLWSFWGGKWSLDGSGSYPWNRRSFSSSICIDDCRWLFNNLPKFLVMTTFVKTDFNFANLNWIGVGLSTYKCYKITKSAI